MVKYNYLQPYPWFEIQNYLLKRISLFSVETIFSLLQIAKTITSGNLIQHDDRRITQDFAELNQFSFIGSSS